MHICLTRLFKDGAAIADYDLERRLCEGFQALDWGDNNKIEEAIADIKDDENEAKDP